MATAFLGEVKKQASCFLQDKYKQARLAFSDVTPAEILVEEATNGEPCVPDARTMTCITEAAFDMDDYCRIANILHQRLRSVDWKEWRQVYKTLVVLEFLLTHGPEELPREFFPDVGVMQDLRRFNYIDEKGFDWGVCMQKRTDSILTLLTDRQRLKEARCRAIKITQEIQGFGNQVTSPSSASSSSSSSNSSKYTCRTSSFGSHYSDSPSWYASDEKKLDEYFDHEAAAGRAAGWSPKKKNNNNKCCSEESDEAGEGSHSWDAPADQETAAGLSLLHCRGYANGDSDADGGDTWSARFCSRMFGTASNHDKGYRRVLGMRSFSQAERRTSTRKIERQLSLGY